MLSTGIRLALMALDLALKAQISLPGQTVNCLPNPLTSLMSLNADRFLSSMALASGGYYVKIQMPTGDTTQIMVEEHTSFAELLNKIAAKKDMTIVDGSCFVLSAGTLFHTYPEQTLSNFKDLEKVQIYGTICTLT